MPRSKNEICIIVIEVDNEISLCIYYITSNDGLRDLTKGGLFFKIINIVVSILNLLVFLCKCMMDDRSYKWKFGGRRHFLNQRSSFSIKEDHFSKYA
jgi:hypothetical protein